LRAAFLVSQIALAVVLLFSAGLLVRSLLAVQSVDAGFGNLQVLTASLRFDNAKPRANRVRLCREAIGRIRRLPGVRSAGAIGSMFWEHGAGKFGLREVEGRPPDPRDQWTALTWTSVAGDYFQTLGVPLLRGRWFSDRDREDTPPVVMINQTMARRYWPAEDPIGKRIKGFDARGKKDDWVTVVGVVRDVRSGGLERIPMAQIFEAQAQSLDATDTLVVSAESVPGLAAAIRGAIRGLDRTAVLTDISTVERRLDAMNTGRRFQTEMLAGFAALALALAAAGIFGAMHYSVTQRTQEIGIRMALGARRRAVLKMVLREGLTLAAAGIGLGAIGAVAAGRAISGLLFGVTPQDPATFAAVLAMLAFVALAGCAVPARRATRVDPMVAIRCD
jgi:putative ABC transport system permease protein